MSEPPTPSDRTGAQERGHDRGDPTSRDIRALDDDVLRDIAVAIATAPLNLVSRADRAHVYDLHVAEARAVTAGLPLDSGTRCLDLGSGGGLPGLVVAALRPDVRVTCLDARRKKADFVAAVARDLGLSNVDAVAERAESAGRDPGMRATFDVVISRAVARTSVVAELARAFLVVDGLLFVVKGPRYREEVTGAESVLRRLRYDRLRVDEVSDAPRPTWLIQMRAVGRAPDWIPRPDGVPQRQPLEDTRS